MENSNRGQMAEAFARLHADDRDRAARSMPSHRGPEPAPELRAESGIRGDQPIDMSSLAAITLNQRNSVKSLLSAAGLPDQDIDNPSIELWAYNDGEALQAAVGLEVFDEVALLRSLVVSPKQQGRGIGQTMLRAIESHALARGIGELWLLTTTAPEFFARHGYQRAERQRAPSAIQHSQEFRSLCPASAVCMRKSLAQSGD